jgi:hypothetical protein
MFGALLTFQTREQGVDGREDLRDKTDEEVKEVIRKQFYDPDEEMLAD